MRRLLFPLLALALLGCAACDRDANPPVSSTPATSFETRFSITFGGRETRLQIALTDLERTRGLMGRRALAPDEGMLFVFSSDEPRSFWMRNVPINISLGYLTADGRLDEIKALYAEDPSTIPSRSKRIRYVIELPEGWFEKNHISPGAQLDLPAVRSAIAARGFSPENFLPAGQ